MATPKGLGRGLGALLGDFQEPVLEKSNYRTVPLHRIEPNPDQPRKDFDEEELEDDDRPESRDAAEAIVKCRKIKPAGYDVPEDREEWGYGEYTSDWWSDLTTRLSEEFDLDIGQEAKEYLTARPDSGVVYRMKITASLMAMQYAAETECYVKDKKVRYISWKEY